MKLIAAYFLLLLFAMPAAAQKKSAFTTADYVRALKHSTDVMVNDVTSPVAAARYYSYITLTANETIVLFDKQQKTFAGVINNFQPLNVNSGLVQQSDPSFAPILALYKAGVRMLPSGYLLRNQLDSLFAIAKKKNISDSRVKATSDLVDSVIVQVMKYVAGDGFSKLSGYRRFTPKAGDGFWQPTAPGFMAAIEPYWSTLRPFLLDSSSQFTTGEPNRYDTSLTSNFYKEMKEVYDIRNNMTNEQANIAMFWDCNPFALQQVGHLEFGLKKISPGGHWIGITGIACKKNKVPMGKTAYAHAIVSLGMCDAFVSCWSNKYKYNRVRPVTAIKRLLDQHWTPLLQTPPFPEYTSGHSVISTTCATILTNLFGGEFNYADDTEVEFGLPVRKYKSFMQACDEAAISRLYGGIHFRDAIVNGVKEGASIGKFVVAKANISSLTAR